MSQDSVDEVMEKKLPVGEIDMSAVLWHRDACGYWRYGLPHEMYARAVGEVENCSDGGSQR